MNSQELLARLDTPGAAQTFEKLYGPEGIDAARRRYAALVRGAREDLPGAGEGPRVFTAAGRTELGGNHTDHNRGKVLAASIQLDAVAVVTPRTDRKVFFRSTGYPDVEVDLGDLSPREDEKGTTEALVRGIAAELARRGVPVGGFSANAGSTVLPGSGLSSSAAVEVLFGVIFDGLYGGGTRSALEIAQIGQKAENLYFGKPCGLMDQTACASGGAVAIDFADPAAPEVRRIDFDPAAAGYDLCVVDTRGSHADLTPDYAAIPAEMKAVAAFLGKEVLRDTDEDAVVAQAPGIRQAAGDRALLRALHFFAENRRVEAMGAALERRDIDGFLALVNASGDSSWELLQNIYSPRSPAAQGLSVALALTRRFLNGRGAARVHGGGFAGTIQVYVPRPLLADYRRQMEACFGPQAVTVLRVRPVGAREVLF